MEQLTLEAFDAESVRFDAAVMASAEVDQFCSSSDWIVPAARALKPGREPFIRRGAHGYLALVVGQDEGRRWLEPLEAMWGMACPLVGADVAALAADAAAMLADSGELASVPVVSCGLPSRSRRLAAWAGALAPRYELRVGAAPTRRIVASLAGGVDGFLSRRGRGFRRALERAQRRATAMGVTMERVPNTLPEAEAAAAYDRLVAIDARTWKAREGVGIGASGMVDFYREMVPRLARRGALRMAFARLDGRDVAYIVGGVMGDCYRGLQFGYEQGLEALSLGNLCQWFEIQALIAEGVARYDLGAAYEYKERWGEEIVETLTLIALPR